MEIFIGIPLPIKKLRNGIFPVLLLHLFLKLVRRLHQRGSPHHCGSASPCANTLLQLVSVTLLPFNYSRIDAKLVGKDRLHKEIMPLAMCGSAQPYLDAAVFNKYPGSLSRHGCRHQDKPSETEVAFLPVPIVVHCLHSLFKERL